MPRWGMVIDLNKCTGCGECVAACKVENNVGISSPDDLQGSRTLLWMDMLTIHEGEYPDVRIRRIPRPCMQCANAPCIKVCPVRATYKTKEGVIAQIFPQCIGCRYCMAACPYTCKSFNWSAPSWPEQMRAALNPDVSVRPAGVVEKCTFCSHRLQKAREEAAVAGRELREGDYVPACVESCPTGAITFGDLDDRDDTVARQARSPRASRLLEDLGTEPSVYYLTESE